MTQHNDDDEKQIRRERFQRKKGRVSDNDRDTFRRNKIPYKRSKIEYEPIDEFDEWIDKYMS